MILQNEDHGDYMIENENRSKSKIQSGTIVLSIFAIISFFVFIVKGIVPIYFFESIGWVILAVIYEKSKRDKIIEMIMIVIGGIFFLFEFINIINVNNAHKVNNIEVKDYDLQSAFPQNHNADNSQSSGYINSTTQSQNNINSVKDDSCPLYIPSNIKAQEITGKEADDLIGVSGRLYSETGSLPYSIESYNFWNAEVEYKNNTNYCIVSALIIFDLQHANKLTKEAHEVVFNPILDKSKTQQYSSKLKIYTGERSEDVALISWKTVKITGFKPVK